MKSIKVMVEELTRPVAFFVSENAPNRNLDVDATHRELLQGLAHVIAAKYGKDVVDEMGIEAYLIHPDTGVRFDHAVSTDGGPCTCDACMCPACGGYDSGSCYACTCGEEEEA